MDERSLPFTRLSLPSQWGVLLVGSVVVASLIRLAGLPASLLLGPMLAAILIETQGGSIRINRHVYLASQAIIGCMIARGVTSSILAIIGRHWLLFFAVATTTVVVCSLLGWLLGRLRVLPGTTAVWGLSPGAATNMILMAEEFGADSRLVAFMQYLRVVIVAMTVAIVSRFWVAHSGKALPSTEWFPTLSWPNFAATLAIAIGGVIFGRVARLPAGTILGPMILGSILRATGLVAIELPPWLLAASYAIMGWVIGLNFTRQIIAHAVRALPHTILSILATIAFCGVLAFLLVRSFGVDPLTAYLATSPGGMDSIAIIAASSKVDLSFVMALQLMRVVIVLLIGPTISRFIARRLEAGMNPSGQNGRVSATAPEVFIEAE